MRYHTFIATAEGSGKRAVVSAVSYDRASLKAAELLACKTGSIQVLRVDPGQGVVLK